MLLAGASGLVGGLVLGLCPDAIPITRRPIGRPGVVADFDDLPPLPTRGYANMDGWTDDAMYAYARQARAAPAAPAPSAAGWCR
jgi:hypothetical protein